MTELMSTSKYRIVLGFQIPLAERPAWMQSALTVEHDTYEEAKAIVKRISAEMGPARVVPTGIRVPAHPDDDGPLYRPPRFRPPDYSS